MIPNLENKYTISENGCWLWKKDEKLPRVKYQGKMVVVRRLLWMSRDWPLSTEQRLVAYCSSKCINPEHATIVDKAVKPLQYSCKYGHELVASNRVGKLNRCRTCANESTRHYNHVRRLAEYGKDAERIDDTSVFERDKWICQICFHKVSPDISRRESLGATLDHKVPLARGGSHTYANVQLAHSECNSRKWCNI